MASISGVLRPGRAASRGLFLVALAVITALALVPIEQPPVVGTDWLSHIAAFFLLSVLALWAFPGARPLKGILPALLAYGLFIEVTQHFLPFRTFAIADLLADLAGIVAGLVFVHVLRAAQGNARATDSAGPTLSASNRDSPSSSA